MQGKRPATQEDCKVGVWSIFRAADSNAAGVRSPENMDLTPGPWTLQFSCRATQGLSVFQSAACRATGKWDGHGGAAPIRRPWFDDAKRPIYDELNGIGSSIGAHLRLAGRASGKVRPNRSAGRRLPRERGFGMSDCLPTIVRGIGGLAPLRAWRRRVASLAAATAMIAAFSRSAPAQETKAKLPPKQEVSMATEDEWC